MNRLPRLSLALLRGWTALYTWALPAEQRRQRRDLVEADAWDQIDEAARGNESPVITATALLLRLLRGVPDDVTWRLSVHATTSVPIELSCRPGRRAMQPKESFLLTAGLSGLAWALVVVLVAAPTAHSLAYAGLILMVVALAGWTIEARFELEVQDSSSVWPIALAGGVGGAAAGLLVSAPWAGLLLALPLAVFASRGWVASARGLDPLAVGLQPVPPPLIEQRALAGDAIAIEKRQSRTISRRAILRTGIWLGVVSALAAGMSTVVDFLWNRSPEAFGGVVVAGKPEDFPPGSKTKIPAGKFWLVNLTAAQGGPGYLALWQKCPHLGCTVPWEPNFIFAEPNTGDKTKGWFRCPCHQSTYNDAGVRVYGPAPRSMDHMAVRIDSDSGRIEVDTGRISRGTTDNASFAVPAEA
jgi:cytochrome b6-f complex iron-sulfur subunit